MNAKINCRKLRLEMLARNISPKTLANRAGLHYNKLIVKISKDFYICNEKTLDKIIEALNKKFDNVEKESLK